jgi:hypothetical protein
VQRLTLSPSVLGFNGRKGGLQSRKSTDLLGRDPFGVRRHGLHKGGPLGAKLLNQSAIRGQRGMVVIHRVVLSDGAPPNPPAAFWQQGAVLTDATALFYPGYPWELSF